MSGFRCRQHGLWRNVLRVLPLLTLASTTLTLTGPEARAQNTPGIAAESAAGVSTTLPFVSPIFGDNMVMQRGKINTIWGWSHAGDTIQVVIGDHSVTANTGKDGRWEARILPPETPGPWTMHIYGKSQTREIQNVLIGDVWLAGGQSNMALPLKFAKDGDAEVLAADEPEIRYFTVSGHAAYHHKDLIEGSWKVLTPDTAASISAVGYYFARKLHEDIHAPIGLVIDAVGGTPAESWTSAQSLAPLGDFDPALAELKRLADSGAPEYGNFVMHWYDRYDIGLKGNWKEANFDDTAWKPITIPGGFSELGVPDTPALVWFRKEINLPDPLPVAPSIIALGSIERMDTVYINGTEVGSSAWVENPRRYFIPPAVLKPGRNVIAIRVLKTKPAGGFLSKPDDLQLNIGDGAHIPLAGVWKAQLSVDARPPQPLPMAYENWPVMPAVLYEGMLAPIAPLTLRGVIWYQGEQNSGRGYQYRKILPVMIRDWRNLFQQADLPFYVAGLPAFQARQPNPTDDGWADLRESQALTVDSVPHTCLAVTIDTGEADNIHPKEKKPVGDRLAACALAGTYRRAVVASGPTLISVEDMSNALRLHFAHTDGGLVVKGDTLGEFSVAGEDGRWAWANAKIDGDTVMVSSPAVPHPVVVRYAWQSNPLATLFNGAGFPAAPFRTDTYTLVTQ
ncbi:sialate O-acetylesterase [Asticcacaulis taihuensis]|uniref:sialate O-acetylesterase n=1 Tax=Asticcacaulis taihuensis TaxID=260084 RepID=UPI003F7C4E05